MWSTIRGLKPLIKNSCFIIRILLTISLTVLKTVKRQIVMINLKFLIKDPMGCLLVGRTKSQKDVIKNCILMVLGFIPLEL